MVDPAVLVVFGLNRQELTAIVGVVGGIAVAASVLAMVILSVLPAYSRSWADRLGVGESAGQGVDPVEALRGRPEPVPANAAASDVDRESELDVHEETAVDGEAQAVQAGDAGDAPVADGGGDRSA